MGESRPLLVVDSADSHAVLDALSAALFDNGPALLPRLWGAADSRTAPLTVHDEAAVVIETSGTTGRPKRVWLSAEALIASATCHLEALPGPGVWWLTLPTSYIAGLQVLTRSLLSQTTPLVAPAGPFSPDSLLDISAVVEQAKASQPVYSAMVPAQLRRLVDAASDNPDLGRALMLFDAILVGGQAVPPELIADADRLGLTTIRTYGSAETAGGCVWNGRPLPGVQVAEKEGRLAISAPFLAGGYLDNPELTTERFVTEDGQRWYLTDDQGVVAPDATVTVTGRVDDVIVSGGKKVSLAEVEALVIQATGLTECVVVAGQHPEWGQTPVVVSTESFDLDAVRQLVSARMGPEARPDRGVLVDAIPLLGSGKPDRIRLTALVSQ